MATSSFTKTFVFDKKAVKIIKKQPAVQVSASANDRIEEGKRALTQFSPLLRK